MSIEEKCPLCGGDIMETTRGFCCGNWKEEDGGCKFTIWKEAYGAKFNREDVAALIKGSRIQKENRAKSGNIYQASWYLDAKKQARFDMES